MAARISPDPSPPRRYPELSAAEFAHLLRLPPERAVAFLEAKGVVITFDWRDLWRAANQDQFTISRLARLDLLQGIQDLLAQSVGGDLGRRDWVRQVRELLARSDWWGTIEVRDPVTGRMVETTFDSARLRLIYDVNTRNARAVGRWERFEATKAAFPYLRYVTKDDAKVRESHQALHQLVLPVDHPLWDIYAPPNGWRCRCTLVAMSQADYEAGTAPNGERLNKAPPEVQYRDWVNRRTGEVMRVPRDIDPGWDYNPGKRADRSEALAQQIERKLAAADARLAAAARQAGLLPDQATPAQQLDAARLAKLDGDARKWVVAQGKAADREYLVAYDATTGKELARTGGAARDRLPLPPDLVESMNDRTRAVVLHHNHPDSFSLSLSDLGYLAWLGTHAIVAHGHDGASFRAQRGPDFGVLPRVMDAARTAHRRQIEIAQAKRIDTSQLEAHILNLALAGAGLIIYESVLAKPARARWARDSAAYQAMVQAIVDAITRAR